MKTGNEVWVQFGSGKILFAVDDRLTAGLHAVRKRIEIQSQVLWPVVLQVGSTGMVQFPGPASVSATVMVQADGNLDQALVEFSRCAPVFQPEPLPRLVSLKELALIEPAYSLQVTRIIAFTGQTIFLRSRGRDVLQQGAGRKLE